MLSTITLQDIKNKKLYSWITEMAQLCNSKDVYICDGSKEEFDSAIDLLVKQGAAILLEKKKDSYLFRSDPSDVARVEDRTFICTEKQEDAGPTNNWMSLEEMKKTMTELYRNCMQGKAMYVVPFSMGPLSSPFSMIGVEITDSPYVVAHMHIMTRVSSKVLEVIGEDKDFTKCMHSCGHGAGNKMWECAPMDKKFICHDTKGNSIYAYGSGYGGNAILGKKCLALRIASAVAEGTDSMAEHMLILRLTSPENKQYHVAGAFPSACGKTNLAMLSPSLKGWKVECLGDDIAWLRIGKDGRLRAINPETGFFGVAPGTSKKTNLNAMKTIEGGNVLFTNCALTDDGDVWWEGLEDDSNKKKPEHLIDWQGNDWTKDSGKTAAHPNARFTVSVTNCPILASDWEQPEGVPIDVILFGGKRSNTAPLIVESFDWTHGVFLGATACSETTAANIGAIGVLRYDPMAMTPFCGYNMGDYFQHWLNIGTKLGHNAPKIFRVNWFNKDEKGNYAWPGFGDNIRVLEWICKRVEKTVSAKETPLGYLPNKKDFNFDGLNMSEDVLEILLSCNADLNRQELLSMESHLNKLGDRLPKELWEKFSRFQKALENNHEIENTSRAVG